MSQAPIELCELVDADGRSNGKVVPRGSDRLPDEYFPVIHLWILDEDSRFLIQRRASHLMSQPGLWATTAGYVQAGESTLDAVVREASEEMGLRIEPGTVQSMGHWLAEHRCQSVFLLRASHDELGEIAIGEEVSAYRWEGVEAISAMVEDGRFVTYGYFEQLIRPLTRNVSSPQG